MEIVLRCYDIIMEILMKLYYIHLNGNYIIMYNSGIMEIVMEIMF